VLDAQITFPISLQSVYANLALVRHVRVENLGYEIALRWRLRIVLGEYEADFENSSSVWRSGGTCFRKGFNSILSCAHSVS
jgi:hypothetical protein